MAIAPSTSDLANKSAILRKETTDVSFTGWHFLCPKDARVLKDVGHMALSSRPTAKIYDKNLIFYYITSYYELIWQIEKFTSPLPICFGFSGHRDLQIFHIANQSFKLAFSQKFQLLG